MTRTLTPTQRAILQFVDSLLITAIIAGFFSIAAAIAGNGPIDWKQVLLSFALAFVFSVAHSIAAYFKASSQPDVGIALDAVLQELEKRYPILGQQLSSSPEPPLPTNGASEPEGS